MIYDKGITNICWYTQIQFFGWYLIVCSKCPLLHRNSHPDKENLKSQSNM